MTQTFQLQPLAPSWPLYFNDLLHTNTNTHPVAIITLWSKKEIYISSIPKGCYNTIGQLYSREEGLSALVRNLLANKHIRHLVMLGADLNHCAQAVKGLFEHGVNEQNEIICEFASKLDPEISKEGIEDVRKNVTLHDIRHIKDRDEINKYLENLQTPLQAYGEYQTFKEFEITPPDTFPTQQGIHNASGKHIKDVWIQILKLVMRFGTLKKSQHSDDQQELIALTSIITSEDPLEPKLIEEFGFTLEELQTYIPQVTSSKEIEGMEYTYGQRLRSYFLVDQVENIISDLKAHSYSRRALASTWSIEKDSKSSNPPCLDLVQALIQDNKLYLTCYFRSNDMFEAWPRNAFALRQLQYNIAQELKIDLGNLIIISNSAHIYKRSFEKAKEIISKYEKKVHWDQDPHGTVTILLKDEQIVVRHLNPNGSRLNEYSGKTAMMLYKQLANDKIISDISHAMDIGCELQKAEIALQNNLEYLQDRPLKLN